MTIKRGDVLANGAIVLDYAPSLDPKMGKVIAMAHGQSPLHPYVIWSYNTMDSGEVYCVGGKYFDDLRSALHLWHARYATTRDCLDCDPVDGEHHYDCQTNWV